MGSAGKPAPAHGDGHFPADGVLAWRPGKSATAHRVYVGTDAAAVARATPASPEFKGERAEANLPTAGLGLSHRDLRRTVVEALRRAG